MSDMVRYAVRVRDVWYVAVQLPASTYTFKEAAAHTDQMVWADAHTTGWICLVGEETQFINLTAIESASN